MKKQLLALSILVTGMANAQVWTQNFNSAVPPALPAGWMQNNVDALTTNTSIASYSFGTNAGVTRNVTSAFGLPTNYSISLITTSRYATAGVSDDWVISPTFSVPANAVFNWEATSFDPSIRNSYEIRISTTGTAVASFTAPANLLFSTPQETYNPTGAWMSRGVSLAAFAGQNVNIAVHENSSNKWQLALDNFAVTVPAQAKDGSIISVNGLTRYMVGAGNQVISGTFKQLGYSTATTVVMGYKVNNNPAVTQTITFAPPVAYFGTSVFSFSTQANMGLGTNRVKVWVSSIDGTSEVVNNNDTAFQTVYVASVSKTRNALIEEWSSSTCAPCAQLNVTNGFDALLNANSPNSGGRVNVIKNQVNWPSPGTDPSYNAFSAGRVNYYGINAAPTTIRNGTLEMVNHNQAEIDAAKAVPALAEITASLTVTNGTVVAGNATITPYVTVSGTNPLVVHQVLLQQHYNYQGGTTIQKDYYHVMREMFPSVNGAAFSSTDGVPQTVNFNKNITIAVPTVSGSTNFWTETGLVYEYVVFVQDIISDDVLQSGSAMASISTGVVEYKNNSSIGVYPNPAKDFATVGIKLNNPSVVDITITDITGKVVYSNLGSQVNGFENEITINTSEFATGTYNVMVKTNEGVMTEKLIVVK